MPINWGARVSRDEMQRRAAGRRRYNAVRRFRRTLRRAEVAERLARCGGLRRGVLARIAAELGVHRSTVSRDLAALVAELHQTGVCPVCGRGRD